MILKHDILIISAGRIITALIALISIRSITKFLTPEQYGELALLISIQMFCGLFIINPVGQYINLQTHSWWSNSTLFYYLKLYRKYVLSASFIGGLMAFLFFKSNSQYSLFITVVVTVIMVIAGTWNATLIPMLNMLGFRATSVFWSIVTAFVSLISSILFVQWWPSSTAWLAGQSIGMIVGGVGAGVFLRQRTTLMFSKILQNSLIDKKIFLTYCAPLALATGLMWMQLSGYRFLVEYYWSLTQLGFLAMGFQLAAQLSALTESSVMQLIHPLFYKRISSNNEKLNNEIVFSDLLNTLIPVYLILSGMFLLMSQYVIKILMNPEYWDSIYYVIFGIFIEFCRIVGNLLGNAAQINKKTKSLTAPYFVGVIVTFSSIFVVGFFDLDIKLVAFSLFIGSISMLIVMIVNMYKQVRFTLDVKRIFFSFAVTMLSLLSIELTPVVYTVIENISIIFIILISFLSLTLLVTFKNPSAMRLIKL